MTHCWEQLKVKSRHLARKFEVITKFEAGAAVSIEDEVDTTEINLAEAAMVENLTAGTAVEEDGLVFYKIVRD